MGTYVIQYESKPYIEATAVHAYIV